MAELRMRRNLYSARGDFGFGGFQSPTGSMTTPGSGGTLASILQLASNVLGPALSGVGQVAPAPMQLGGSLLPSIGGNTIGNYVNSLLGTGASSGGDAMFTASGAPRQRVALTSPINGRMYWVGNLGAPILFRGDLRARDRVNRVASLAARGRSRRSRRRFR